MTGRSCEIRRKSVGKRTVFAGQKGAGRSLTPLRLFRRKCGEHSVFPKVYLFSLLLDAFFIYFINAVPVNYQSSGPAASSSGGERLFYSSLYNMVFF